MSLKQDPTKLPTPAKAQRGLKAFEEGFVIYEALANNGQIPLPMEAMWKALALYREAVKDYAKSKGDA